MSSAAEESRPCQSCGRPLPPPGKRGPERRQCDGCTKVRSWAAGIRRLVAARPELEAVARRELGHLGPLAKLGEPTTRPPIRDKRRDVYIGHVTWQWLKSDARRMGETISAVLRGILREHYGAEQVQLDNDQGRTT